MRVILRRFAQWWVARETIAMTMMFSAVAVALLLCTLYAGFEAVQDYFGGSEYGLRIAAYQAPRQATWFVAGWMLTVALTAAIVVSLRALRECAKGAVRAMIIVGAATLGVTLAALGHFRESAWALFRVLGAEATGTGLDRAAGYLAALGLAATIIVVSALLANGVGVGSLDVEGLRKRLGRHRLLLYLAAVGLAAGTVATQARLELAVDRAYYSDSSEQAGVLLGLAGSIASAASKWYGGVFTVALLVGVAPGLYFMNRRGHELARKKTRNRPVAKRHEESQAFRKASGLDGGVPTRVGSAFATMAPVLASLLEGYI